MSVLTETPETKLLTDDVLDSIEHLAGMEALLVVCLAAIHEEAMFSSNIRDGCETRFYKKLLRVGAPLIPSVCFFMESYLNSEEYVSWHLIELVRDLVGPYEVPNDVAGQNLAVAKLALEHAKRCGHTW